MASRRPIRRVGLFPPRAGLTRSDQIFTSCFLDLQIHDKLFKQHDIRDDQGSRACTIVLLISALVSPDTMLLMTVALERIGLGIAGCWAHGARVRAGEVFCHVQTLDTQPPTLSILSYISWWTALLAHVALYWNNAESN